MVFRYGWHSHCVLYRGRLWICSLFICIQAGIRICKVQHWEILYGDIKFWNEWNSWGSEISWKENASFNNCDYWKYYSSHMTLLNSRDIALRLFRALLSMVVYVITYNASGWGYLFTINTAKPGFNVLPQGIRSHQWLFEDWTPSVTYKYKYSRNFETKTSLYEHKLDIHDRLRCNICNYMSYGKKDLKLHMKDVHDNHIHTMWAM